MKTCRAYALPYRLAGWLFLALFVPSWFLIWPENLAVAVGILGLLILIGIFVVIDTNSTLEITSEMIIAHRLYGRYGIRWDEIETIRYSVGEGFLAVGPMVLEGKFTRLAIPEPGCWGGAGVAESRRWFYEEARRRGLEIKQSKSIGFKFTRHARLS